MRIMVLAFAAFCVAGWAQNERPNLSGTWQLDSSKSQFTSGKPGGMTWVIDEKDDAIRMKVTEKDEVGREHDFDINCGLGGKECSFKDVGGESKATFWYNGPVLVEMITRGKNDRVSKTRMKLADDGKSMNVEVKSIVPPSDKAETLVFTKQVQPAALAK
jgi:hypothetical protein